MASWKLPNQNAGVKGRRPGCPAAFTLVRKGRRRPILLTHMETASMRVNPCDGRTT